MLVAVVVGATLVVASKGFGFVENVELKALVGLEGCMWGCSGMLGRMVRGWGMPKSNGVDAKAATESAVAGLVAECNGYN